MTCWHRSCTCPSTVPNWIQPGARTCWLKQPPSDEITISTIYLWNSLWWVHCNYIHCAINRTLISEKYFKSNAHIYDIWKFPPLLIDFGEQYCQLSTEVKTTGLLRSDISTHCDVIWHHMNLYGYWFVAWQDQAITWTNVDSSSVKSCENNSHKCNLNILDEFGNKLFKITGTLCPGAN